MISHLTFLKHSMFALVLASPILVSGSAAISAEMKALKSGVFLGVDGNHKGSGKVELIHTNADKTLLKLSGFDVTPGPDLKVILVKASNIKSSEDVTKSEFVSLGALQAPTGDQSYELPVGLDGSKYGSAAIWCETYSFLFASAPLN